MAVKYRTDQYYVSPWDFYPEVTKDFNIKPKVLIHDVSLREGEQQTGVVFNQKDKVEIAKKLAELGVDRIEAGMPAVSQQDEAAVKEIVQLNLGPKIFAFCRCMASDIELARKAGCDGATLEIACNPLFVEKAYGKTIDWAKKAAIEATIAAKECGLYVSFFTIDGTRTEIDVLLDIVDEIQQKGHMDAFVLADTFGCVHPQSVFPIIRKVKQRFSCPVEAHMHMHFGLGAANTLTAIAAGAEVAHVAVSGIGEGAGNTPLEDVVLSLKCLYGVETRVKTEKFCEISKFVCKKTNNHPLPPNRPIVGRDVFRVESGIGVMFFNNAEKNGDPKIVGSFQPELVGQPGWEFVLGKKSGIFSIEKFLKQIGRTLDKDQQNDVLNKVKDLSLAEKRLVSIEEFKKFVDEAARAGANTGAR
jgi:isopropylmalate/homocitrate/citramalate synthase